VSDVSTAATLPGRPDVPVILALRDVRAAYGAIEVLHGVTIEVPTGSVVALLGPNGAGKTTTISVASGLMPVTGGALEIAGVDVTGVGATDLARAGVCTVPEGRGVFPNLTVTENLLMASYTGVPRTEIRDKAFDRFPRLAERRNQLAGTMSGGEQQMLAMARALGTDPVVLMLDELSMGLAPKIVSQLYEQVAAIAADGVSVLVVEQFARSVLGVADIAVVMAHGTVQWSGPAGDLDDELLASTYLGGP
jgi:branched-chain amino acid transport system ATP-binding protein